ncbi:MAG: hypothetical protein H7A43_09765 [Verrucomicrobia bacterium]|nr:hypothetical protein [Verrucomicrobiota bacterium]
MKIPQFLLGSRKCRSFRENCVIQERFERFEPSAPLSLDSADSFPDARLLVKEFVFLAGVVGLLKRAVKIHVEKPGEASLGLGESRLLPGKLVRAAVGFRLPPFLDLGEHVGSGLCRNRRARGNGPKFIGEGFLTDEPFL